MPTISESKSVIPANLRVPGAAERFRDNSPAARRTVGRAGARSLPNIIFFAIAFADNVA
jgi:hypothetical protein